MIFSFYISISMLTIWLFKSTYIYMYCVMKWITWYFKRSFMGCIEISGGHIVLTLPTGVDCTAAGTRRPQELCSTLWMEWSEFSSSSSSTFKEGNSHWPANNPTKKEKSLNFTHIQFFWVDFMKSVLQKLKPLCEHNLKQHFSSQEASLYSQNNNFAKKK